MFAQLVVATGFSNRDTLVFASLLAVNCALVYFLPRGGDRDLGWRLRLLFYPVAMNLLYFVLGTAIPAIHSGHEDAALQAVDRALIGTNLSIRMQPWVSPVLTDFFSFCYMLYFLYLILGQFIVSTLMGLGALCLFLWAAASGLLRDVESVKYQVLDSEGIDHDR